MLDGDLVAEAYRGAGPGVRDQGLVLVQFQLAVVAQELGQAGFDLLGFGPGPGEPEEVIICVAGIAQPPEAGVTGIPGGHAAPPRAQPAYCGTVAAFARALDCADHPGVGRVDCPARAPGVFRYESCLDEFVQPVQVNIGEDG